MIADEQCRFHGLRRNLEGLDDKGGAEESEQDGDEQRFGVFDDGTAGRFAMHGLSETAALLISSVRCFDRHRFL